MHEFVVFYTTATGNKSFIRISARNEEEAIKFALSDYRKMDGRTAGVCTNHRIQVFKLTAELLPASGPKFIRH